MNTETRDRAFDRVVVIDLKDKDRMLSILETIPREDLVKSQTHKNGEAFFILKIKKQELLMIKLAIQVKSIKRTKKQGNTFRSLNF